MQSKSRFGAHLIISMIALDITCIITVASCGDTASDNFDTTAERQTAHRAAAESRMLGTPQTDESDNADNGDDTVGSFVRDEPHGEHRFSKSDEPRYAWYDNIFANYSVKIAKEWRVERLTTDKVVFAGNAIWWSQNTNGIANDPFEVEITYIAHPDNDPYGDWVENLAAETETRTETVTVKGFAINLRIINDPAWMYTRCAYIVVNDDGVVRIELRYGRKDTRHDLKNRGVYYPSPQTLKDFYTTLQSVQEFTPT